MSHSKFDTLLAPRRTRSAGDPSAQQWLELDLVLKPRPRGQLGGRSMFRGSGYFGSQEIDSGPAGSPGAGRRAGPGGSGVGSSAAGSGMSAGATEDVWVVLDVQSFLEKPSAAGAPGADGAPPRSVVRVNVARRRNLERLDPREHRELNPDGALEVVGYIPI